MIRTWSAQRGPNTATELAPAGGCGRRTAILAALVALASIVLLAAAIAPAQAAPPSKPQCADGIDNDNDNLIDYARTGGDPGCTSRKDTSESSPVTTTDACSDGVDNDRDTRIDYPADPGCESASDGSERGTLATGLPCDDGVDNDADTVADYPEDPGCGSPFDFSELGLADCDDGIDNDSDTFADYPDDPGCSSPRDTGELGTTDCDDGADNDSDGSGDYPSDSGCTSPSDASELGTTACDDGIDNDSDTLTDHPADAGCSSPGDHSELGEADCDVDGDGRADQPPTVPNATVTCQDGMFAMTCDPGFQDTNGDQLDGCETATPDDDCDGLDNDGDGVVDDGYTPVAVPNGVTVCRQNGITDLVCDPGYENANGEISDGCERAIPDDQCDGIDNDGDGQADEDFVGSDVPNGETRCRSGVTEVVCDPGYENANGEISDGCEQAMPDDQCDGIDNDGDGQADEDFVGDQVANGVIICRSGAREVSCEPGYEDRNRVISDGCEAARPAD